MEEAVKKIRSVLISTKGHVDIRELQRDFRVLIGEEIPYRKLGFNNLEQMLRQAPTLKVHDGPRNQVFVEALPLNTSAHMAQLISKQKTAKRRGGSGRLPFRQYNPNRNHHIPRFNIQRLPPPSNQAWRAPIVGKSRLRPYMHQIVVQNTNKSETSPQDRLQRKMTPPKLSPNSTRDSSSPISESSSRKLHGRLGRISTPKNDNTSQRQSTVSNSPISPSYAPRQSVPPKDCSQNSRPRMRTHSNFTGPISLPSPQLIANVTRFPCPSPTRQLSFEAPVYSSKSSPSSPDVISAATFQNKTSEFAQLRQFLQEQGLGEPVVKLKRFCKKDSVFFACVIQFDSKSFSSYPTDCKSPEQAEKIASEMSIKALTKQNRKKSLLYSTEQDVLSRIPPIIECHFGGLISNQIDLDYQESFEELLPANWVALLDTLPTISVEPIMNGLFILKVCNIGDKEKNSTTYSSNNNDVSARQVLSDISIPSNKVHLHADGWMVQITYISSTIEVWCRRIGTVESEQYHAMFEKMQTHYVSNGWAEMATNVTTGGFYVVPFEDCWSRVRVLNVGEREVTCFFLDYGDEHILPRSNMHVLKREFAKEQAQAFICRLAGLEELASVSSGDKHLVRLIDSEFLAKPQLDGQEEQEERGASAIPIFLYNVDENVSPDESDVNLLLMNQIVGGLVPALDEENINLVYVCHIRDDGDVYVQLQNESINKLNELISALESTDFSGYLPGNHIPQFPDDDASILYLYKYQDKYYRAKVTERSPEGKFVCLHMIDVGSTDIIPLNKQKNVYPLNRISAVLCAFPPQAIRIQLDLDVSAKEGTDFVNKIRTLLPNDKSILLKVLRYKISEDELQIPVCELFRRSESRNELFSINASMKYKDALQREDSNNNSDRNTELAKKLERLSLGNLADVGTKPVPSTGNLASPKLPASGEFFDVVIPVAVNPYNFYVQPHETGVELKQLMMKLQLRYEKSRNECLQFEEVIPGHIYASKNNDGQWYRTSVIKVINAGSISVFYCDFGYYDNLTVQQLVPLAEEYLSLPYQAIKARLAGIQPRDEKWSMEDCENFERLVSKKTFVSIVVEEQKDILYQCDSILIIKLIDTSGEEDVHIDKLLVQKGMAKEDSKFL